MTFAEKLCLLRQSKGVTQAQLAKDAGIPLGTLRDYEQGKRRRDPSLATAVKLAEALGTDCRTFAECVDHAAGEPAPREKAPPKRQPRKRK